MFALLCAGVLIVGWTCHVVASTIISSTIEAPPLGQAAVITSPMDGDTFTDPAVTVAGTCPDNSYVNLYINNLFAGVSWCVSNQFSIAATLYNGANVLKVQDYNQTDLQGPLSATITVTYNAPAGGGTSGGGTSGGGGTSSGGGSGSGTNSSGTSSGSSGQHSGTGSSSMGNTSTGLPMLLGSDYHFETFIAGHQFSWAASVEGGTPPYNVYINWSDGSSGHLYFPTDPPFTIRHVYQAPGYYPVIVRAVDHRGSVKTLQLAALITDAAGRAAFLGNAGTPTASPKDASYHTNGGYTYGNDCGTARGVSCLASKSKLLLVAWPSYLVIALMTASFWLGERKEFYLLHSRTRQRTH